MTRRRTPTDSDDSIAAALDRLREELAVVRQVLDEIREELEWSNRNPPIASQSPPGIGESRVSHLIRARLIGPSV